MEYRQLGRSGLKVPELCFGAGTFGTQGQFFEAWASTSQEEADRIIDICMEAGLNFFDTADIYSDGGSETVLGKALAHLTRDRVLISTKATFRFGAGPNDVGSSPLPPHRSRSKPRSSASAPTTSTSTTSTPSTPPPPSKRPSTPSTSSSARARSATSPAPTSPAGT